MKLFHYLQKPRKIWSTASQEYTNAHEGTFTEIISIIPDAIGWDIQNIADYFYERDHQDVVPLLAGEDGGLIPPWEHCWVEWRSTRQPITIGALVMTIDADGIYDDIQDELPDAKWEVDCILFAWEDDSQFPTGPILHFGWFLDDQGRNIQQDRNDRRLAAYMSEWKDDYHSLREGEENYFFAWHCADIVMLACKFANCRNVTMREVLPSRQVRRAAERRGEPLVTHHTLEIGVMPTTRKVYQDHQSLGGHRRLHIARGSFATYSEDRPLFGKYAGRFWRPAHVKGGKELGRVGKDYAISKP